MPDQPAVEQDRVEKGLNLMSACEIRHAREKDVPALAVGHDALVVALHEINDIAHFFCARRWRCEPVGAPFDYLAFELGFDCVKTVLALPCVAVRLDQRR